jgi:hypothetical protein
VTNVAVADGALSQAKISGLTPALSALAPINNPSFTTGISTPLVTLPAVDANKILLFGSATSSRIAHSAFHGVDFYAGPGNLDQGYYRFFAGSASGHVERFRVDLFGAQVFGTLGVTGATTFTGVPIGPTATAGTSTGQLATTQFVQTAVSTRAALAGAIFTGEVSAPRVRAQASLASAGNVQLSASNTGNLGFASLYLTCSNPSLEDGQLFVGQGGGLTIATNTNHPITLSVNRFIPGSSSSMVLGTDRNVSVTNNLSVGGLFRYANPTFSVGMASGVSFPTNVVTTMLPTVTLWQTPGLAVSSIYNSSDGRFTVPAGMTGRWFFQGNFQAAELSVNRNTLTIRVNDTTNRIRCDSAYGASCGGVLYLVAGDFVTFTALHSNETDSTFAANPVTQCTCSFLG